MSGRGTGARTGMDKGIGYRYKDRYTYSRYRYTNRER